MAGKKIKKYFFFIILFISLSNFGAGTMKNQEIEVTGRIFLMGHEPFTQVAIELADGHIFALIRTRTQELRSLQGKQVIIKGISRGKTPQGIEELEVKEFKVKGPK